MGPSWTPTFPVVQAAPLLSSLNFRVYFSLGYPLRGDVCSIFFSSDQLLHSSPCHSDFIISSCQNVRCVWCGFKQQWDWKSRRDEAVLLQILIDAWDLRAHRSYLFTHQTPHAALICALLWWVSVRKHLFSRHALLHLLAVPASACKQGDANCLSSSFYGTQGQQTNKSGNFTQQPVKHSHSAHGGKCNPVPSAVIQACTHRNMKANEHNFTHTHKHTPDTIA